MLYYTTPALAEQHRCESLTEAESRRVVRRDHRRRAPRVRLLATQILHAIR